MLFRFWRYINAFASRQIQGFFFRIRFLSFYYTVFEKNLRLLGEPPSRSNIKHERFALGEKVESNFDSPMVEFLKEDKILIRSCVRPGSWEKNKMFISSEPEYLWFPGRVPYFRDLDNLTICGGVPEIDYGSYMHRSESVVITFQHNPPNSFPRNSFTLDAVNYKRDSGIKEFESGFLLDIQGSEFFQHFMIDLMPAIGEIWEFLDRNPNIPIFVRHPKFSAQEQILRDFGVKNRIIQVESREQIYLRNAYWHEFNPLDFTSTVPLQAYRKLSKRYEKRERWGRHLTLIVRGENTRNWMELDNLKNFLLNWSLDNQLKLKILDSSLTTFDEKRHIFRDSEFVIAIHGGANYHSVYMPEHSFFIEIVPIVETETILRYCVGAGINYGFLPIEGSKSDHALKVDLRKLGKLLDQCKGGLVSGFVDRV